MPVKSPFKFLDSYTSADRDIFFGREYELEELHQKLFKSKQLIIYGSSGTGKTSLVQCGLALKLEDTDWLPVIIRRGDDINSSVINSLSQLAVTPIRKAKTMAQYIHSVYLDYFKPVFLIFDQFEELFVFGGEDEIREFIQSIKECLTSELSCRFIFVIRGEYLENIALFEESIPDFFENRMRIERMTRSNASRVITESCKAFHISCSENFPALLLDRLSPSKATIELTYLQVYLDKLYKNASVESSSSIVFDETLLEKSGMIEDVLAEFLDEQVANTKDPETAMTVLKAFVSGEGTKKPCTLREVQDFCNTFGKELSDDKLNAFLKQFVDLRILKDKDETGRYELRHDALATKIYEQISLGEKELLEVRQFLQSRYSDFQRRGALLSEQDTHYLAPYVSKLFLDQDQKNFIERSNRSIRRRRNRRRNVALAIISVILVILAGFTVFAMKQRNEARLQTKIALQKTQEALNEKEQAEKAKEMALDASKQAMDAKQFAELQSKMAEQQKQIAQQQALKAEEQTQYATTQQSIAQQQKQVAEEKSSEALQAKQKADSAKQQATRLKLLALSQTLAFKSLQAENEPQLCALLAYESCQLNQQNGGSAQDPQIYSALYENLKKSNEAFSSIAIRSKSDIKAMGISNSGQNILVLNSSGSLNIFSGADYSLQNTIPICGNKTALNTGYVSPNGKFVITAYEDNSIVIFNVDKSSASPLLTGHTGLVRAAAFSSDGSFFATGGRDSTVIIWSNNAIQKKIRFDDGIRAMSVSPDNATMAVGCRDGSMYLLNVSSGTKKSLGSISPARIQSATYSRQGNDLVFGNSNSGINVFYANGNPLKTISDNTTSSIDYVAMDENLKVLVTASASANKIIYVYNLADLSQKPIVIKDVASPIVALTLFADGKILVGCADNTIRQYDVRMEHLQSSLFALINRNFTTDEWNTYIGNDVPYQKIKPTLQ